jgi:hypothetical protein
VANKNLVAIATLANEIFTVLEKIFVKFQTSNVYLKKRSADRNDTRKNKNEWFKQFE